MKEGGFEQPAAPDRRARREDDRYENPVAAEAEKRVGYYRDLFEAGLNQGDRIDRSVEVNEFMRTLKQKYAEEIRKDKQFLSRHTLFNLINRYGGIGGTFDLPDGEIAAFLEQFGAPEADTE